MDELNPVVVREHSPLHIHWRWHGRLFGAVAAVCGLFVILTTWAMVIYPGGAFPIARSRGYLFFVNYFSDLGQTRTQAGHLNYPSMALFTIAVALVGLAVIAFFRAFSTFFRMKADDPKALRFNRIATRFGTASGVFFILLALIPENLFAAGHFLSVQGAFNSLLVAIILEIRAIRLTRSISAWLLVINMSFVVVLFGYILLLIFGPPSKTLIGDEINAVGQKIIVYLAIAVIFAQSLLLRAQLPRAAVVTSRQSRHAADV